jgi:hypothetical protein
LAPPVAPVVTPVNISVTPGSTDPKYQFTIDYWPKRRSDTRVFFTQTGPGNPAKPREVEWIATGLTGTQQVVIEAKPGVQTNQLSNPANGSKPAEPPLHSHGRGSRADERSRRPSASADRRPLAVTPFAWWTGARTSRR